MPKLSCQELGALRAGYADRIEERIRECEAAVVDRRFATSRMESPRPLFDQIEDHVQWWGTPKRWWAKDGQKSEVEGAEHGFDAEGKLRTYRGHTYLFYGDDFVDEVVSVDRRGERTTRLTRYVRDGDGEVEAIYSAGNDGGCSAEIFIRENGRILRDEVRRCGVNGDLWADDALSAKHHYEWDGDRVVRVIEEYALKKNPTWKTVKFVAGPDDTVESASELLADAIVENVCERAAAAANADDPLVLVVISYCGEDIPAGCPGGIHLVAASGLRTLVGDDEEEPENRWLLWSPNEWGEGVVVPPTDVPSDRQLEEASLRMLQVVDGPTVFLDGEEILPIRQAMQQGARRLNELDWSQIAPVTEEFVVAILDDSGDFDVFDDIAACVPTAKVKRLVKGGWLPDPSELEGVESDDEE